MKLLYIDCNDIKKHVVLQDVMEHAVNDDKIKKKIKNGARDRRCSLIVCKDAQLR
jgi:hypothetical protein